MYPQDNVLLTGGTGFFGLALLRYVATLGKAAPHLTVLSRDPARFASLYPKLAAQARWLQGDIMQVQALPRGERFSHVIHAAADSTQGPKLSPLERYDQIVSGTRQMLDYALACGARRFLLTSSGGVYGRLPTGMVAVPETYHGMPDPLDPQQAYGVGKRAAEHLCALYSDRIDVVIARCFAFVGQDLPLNVHFAIGNFIRDALWAEQIKVKGNGKPLRSYLDQYDLAHWLFTIMTHAQAGSAYNVGSDRPISMSQLAHLVRDLVSPEKSVQIVGLDDGAEERDLYIPNINKASLNLGLTVTRNLEDAIRITASNAKQI